MRRRGRAAPSPAGSRPASSAFGASGALRASPPRAPVAGGLAAARPTSGLLPSLSGEATPVESPASMRSGIREPSVSPRRDPETGRDHLPVGLAEQPRGGQVERARRATRRGSGPGRARSRSPGSRVPGGSGWRPRRPSRARASAASRAPRRTTRSRLRSASSPARDVEDDRRRRATRSACRRPVGPDAAGRSRSSASRPASACVERGPEARPALSAAPRLSSGQRPSRLPSPDQRSALRGRSSAA